MLGKLFQIFSNQYYAVIAKDIDIILIKDGKFNICCGTLPEDTII